MILTINDLVYISEAAKCLKHRYVALMGNVLIGIDNIKDYISYVELDFNMLSNKGYWSNFIVDTRELSAFLKTVTLESEFEVDRYDGHISTTGGSMSLSFDPILLSIASDQYKKTILIKSNFKRMVNEVLIDDDIVDLKAMRKTDGEYQRIFYDKYFVTLFSGLLPMAKADHVYLTIYDFGTADATFTAEFQVRKKKFTTHVFLAYLKI